MLPLKCLDMALRLPTSRTRVDSKQMSGAWAEALAKSPALPTPPDALRLCTPRRKQRYANNAIQRGRQPRAPRAVRRPLRSWSASPMGALHALANVARLRHFASRRPSQNVRAPADPVRSTVAVLLLRRGSTRVSSTSGGASSAGCPQTKGRKNGLDVRRAGRPKFAQNRGSRARI